MAEGRRPYETKATTIANAARTIVSAAAKLIMSMPVSVGAMLDPGGTADLIWIKGITGLDLDHAKKKPGLGTGLVLLMLAAVQSGLFWQAAAGDLVPSANLARIDLGAVDCEGPGKKSPA
jgi:hypothetical protein